MNLTPHEAQRLAGVLLDDDPGDAASIRSQLPPGPFSRYRITRLVGTGGMGEVYEAQQENPSRRVAIKVIRPDQVSPDLLRRFEHETRILARLQHPGIAPIYEAGQAPTASGPMPFFAMEFVDGRPLTAHANDSNLPIKARLELFLAVCDAVEHAHRKGIIHRDLKPANILIDGRGQPRILDFGIARATDSDIRTTTMHTEVGKLIGTLPYMSPEQAGGDPDELDTRSDVYSLGVILYELLSGRPPFDFSAAKGRIIPQALRAILESDPAPLSSISRAFRGDIETIVGKALAKDREHRYQGVAELARDVRRYLNGEPIAARRPSTWYHLRMFSARNPGLVLASAAMLLTLVLGLVATSWLATAASRARAAAVRALTGEADQRNLAEASLLKAHRKDQVTAATIELLQNVVGAADPSISKGRALTVNEAVDRLASLVGPKFNTDPELEAGVRDQLGRLYQSLGRYADAERELREALRLTVSRADHAPELAAAIRVSLASALLDGGSIEQADAEAREAVSGLDRLPAVDVRTRLTGRYVLAEIEGARGNLEASLEMHQEVLRDRVQQFSDQDTDTITSLNAVAGKLLKKGLATAAEPLARRASDSARSALGEDHPRTTQAVNTLAACLHQLGSLEEAEKLFRGVIDLDRRVLGTSHIATLKAMNNLAMVLLDAKRVDEAEIVLNDTIAAAANRASAQFALGLRANLAAIQKKKGDLKGAATTYERLFTDTRAALGDSHPDSILAEFNLARCLYDQSRFAEALNHFESATQAARDHLPDDHALRGVLPREYGKCLFQLERFDDAERELLESISLLQQAFGIEHSRTQLAIQSLVTLYKRTGSEAKATDWEARMLPQAATQGAK